MQSLEGLKINGKHSFGEKEAIKLGFYPLLFCNMTNILSYSSVYEKG